MMRHRFKALLALAIPVLSSCGFLGGSNSATTQQPTAPTTDVLRFQSSSEQLALPSVQVGENTYADVVLRLGKDGTWSVRSVGSIHHMVPGEPVQAVLVAPDSAVIDTGWRPENATIAISRLHIDAKVYGNGALRLVGNKWYWGGNLKELSALTMADFAANPNLVAGETHHVVLQSAPGNGTQSYPLRLEAKAYKFCMDKQDDDADILRLLNSAGTEVFSLQAGDACVDISPAAGVYTMQHTYGGTGTKRTVFVHPATAATAAPAALASTRSLAPSALAASDPNFPEYWAIYVDAGANPGASGYLSAVGGCADEGNGVSEKVQAIGETSPYVLPGDTTTRTRYLFDGENFFEITRTSDGAPSMFGFPLPCVTSSAGSLAYQLDSAGALGVIGPFETACDPEQVCPTGQLEIHDFANNEFQLGNSVEAVNNWGFNFPEWRSYGLIDGAQQYLGKSTIPKNLRVGFRYFPNGLPPSMKDGTGAWMLAPGELAMFSGAGCTGAAMISESVSLPYAQPTSPIAELDILGGFLGSLQLGAETSATAYSNYLYQGASHVFNLQGCLNFSEAGFSPLSIKASFTPATIVVQTNSCEYCNLAGVDLQNLDLSKNAKLQHANLTGAALSNSNLSNADLRFATLQGARLNYTNLDSANLCHAALNAGKFGAAASLSGAHLKNANLSGADLDGADFSYASFYSDAPQSCQSACDIYAKPVCASAYGASMDSTRFANAYLAGVDMGNASANGASFSTALLFGISFKNANLNRNASTGAATDFSFAFLQGADFTNAQVQDANFTSAYVDGDDSASCIQTKLTNEYTGFPGLLVANTNGTACVAGTQSAPTCIQYVYRAAHRPMTDASNSCPNGAAGPCSDTAWAAPVTPIANSSHPNSSCTSNPICDGFAVPLNTCW